MVERERLREELRRLKRALSTDTELRARYGLAPGAPVTPELWEQVRGDALARLEREAATDEPQAERPEAASVDEVAVDDADPVAPGAVTGGLASAEAEGDGDWEARDAAARARIFGGADPGVQAPPPPTSQTAPLFYEESGDVRWIGMGICLLLSLLLPWAMGGGQLIFSWDGAGQSGWLAFFAIVALLGGCALLVTQFVPAVSDALDIEKRELLGGAIGLIGLFTCTGDLFTVGSHVGAFLGRILLLSLFGLMVGLHARVNTPGAKLSRQILGVSSAVLLLYYLFPHPLPGLPYGGESWQVPLIFLVRLFFLSFDLPLAFNLLIGVPTLLMLVPFPAAILGLWSAVTQDERLDSYLELARRYVTFVIPAALIFMGAFTLFMPVTITLLIWAGANIAVYLLLATEGVSRIIARIAERRVAQGKSAESPAASSP